MGLPSNSRLILGILNDGGLALLLDLQLISTGFDFNGKYNVMVHFKR